MATQKQIEANRKNARMSTGPRTEAGKAASSANALSHGLTAARTLVLAEEEPEEFERLRDGIVADLAPLGALQEALAQRIAGLLWRLDRVARLEAELFVHGQLSIARASLSQTESHSVISRYLGDQLGEKAMEARKSLEKMKQQIDLDILTEAPSAQVLVQRQESARAYDRLARHEATLQRAPERTLAEFRRLREAAVAADNANTVLQETPPDPQPAPSRDGSRRASQVAREAAGGGPGGTRRDGEDGILQNEANSGQPSEGRQNSGAGVNRPTAPPVA